MIHHSEVCYFGGLRLDRLRVWCLGTEDAMQMQIIIARILSPDCISSLSTNFPPS
jgi:hypothetical protein